MAERKKKASPAVTAGDAEYRRKLEAVAAALVPLANGRAAQASEPKAEMANRICWSLTIGAVEAGMVSRVRLGDRRFAQLSRILHALNNAVFMEDDLKALDGADAWATAWAKKPHAFEIAGAHPKTRTDIADEACNALERHRRKGKSRIQAAWLLTRTLGEVVGAYAEDREARRPWVAKIYAAMPLDSHGGRVDRDGTKKTAPFTADPKACVIAALRVFGDTKASSAFAASYRTDLRAKQRARGKKSDTP